MAITQQEISGAEMMEKVLIGGDLSKLSSAERVMYYDRVCKSLGLNPLTKPFDYISLNGKLVLYAKRDATDQLRKINGVSIDIIDRQNLQDVYVVTAKAVDRDGRYDTSTGAVPFVNLKGDALANALMKAETKAKRRVTLSICGLGWLDETEMETIPEAKAIPVTWEDVPAAETPPEAMSTLQDQKTIHIEKSRLKWSDAKLKANLQKQFRTEHTADLTDNQAKKLVAWFKKQPTPAAAQDPAEKQFNEMADQQVEEFKQEMEPMREPGED